jgi:anti-sigma factor RsiW
MSCEPWTEKLDAYFDGELAADEARALDQHVRQCPDCTAESLRRLQLKRAVQAAGQRFTADPRFRMRIQKSIAARQPSLWARAWIPALATACALIVIASILILNRQRAGERQIMSELADLHVATLASANPVDVISTDRHTVKPWFAGKIPFTFNLPELQDSPFVLVGGRVSYLNQAPGAELIFRVRNHQISVFIFQERGFPKPGENGTALSFQVRSWVQNGLRYFVIGDANAQDLDKLSEMLKAAG